MLEPCPFVLSDVGMFQLWTCHPPNLRKNHLYPAWAYFPNLWLTLWVTVPDCAQPLSPDSSIHYAMNVPLNQRRIWPVFVCFSVRVGSNFSWWDLSCCWRNCSQAWFWDTSMCFKPNLMRNLFLQAGNGHNCIWKFFIFWCWLMLQMLQTWLCKPCVNWYE